MDGYSYKFNRVVIIESLEDFEVKTGLENGRVLAGELERLNKATSVEYYLCEGVVDFKRIIKDIIIQSSHESIPILHIECHGDILEGLEFRNGSVISWLELARLIFPLNLATGCNLMLCLSACHAASFLSQMGTLKIPCPCRILVAPATEVNPADCMRGFRIFYSELFRARRVEVALKAIEDFESGEVQWLGEYAEKWFYELATHSISLQYSKEAMKKNVLSMHHRLKSNGFSVKIGDLKNDMQRYMRETGLRLIYEKFFGIDLAPEIDKLFHYVYEDMLAWAQEMREAGRLGF
ncbi:hypothetical protein [Comamonas terrigena]|uniref:hypothetical protein n=1 Tax=Comamonas terrigena TaxID=32013 RepID=UPI00235329A7|nr:hypothetical protein [Comamonas terrigena]